MRLRGWMLVPVVFAVYVLSAAPGMYWRDSPELVLVAYGLDISHPAGSPAYALLGKLATLLPLGSIAFRLNLLSGLGVALAAWALFVVCRRLLRRFGVGPDPAWAADLPALLAASMAAFGLSLWSWGGVAEVYSLEVALLAALLATALGPEPGSANDPGRAELTFLLLGLGAGVHINVALALPVFIVYFLLERPGPRPRSIGLSALAFAAGASVYLYLPARSLADIPYDFGNPETLRGLLVHVSGYSHVDSPLQSAVWPEVLRNLGLIPGHVIKEFGLLYAALCALGALLLLGRRGPALLLYGVAATNVLLFMRTWNVAFGFIPTFAVLALAGALPLGLLFARLARGEGAWSVERGVAGRALTALAGLAALVAPALAHYPLCDMSGHRTADGFARVLLNSAPAEALIVTHNSGLSYPLFCMQIVWRSRPDVVHLHRAHLADPGYVAANYPGMEGLVQAGAAAPLAARLAAVAAQRPLLWDYPLDQESPVPASALTGWGALARWSDDAPQQLAPGQDKNFREKYSELFALASLSPRDWSARQLFSQLATARARLSLDAGNREAAEDWFGIALELARRPSRGFPAAMYVAPFANAAQLELERSNDPAAALAIVEAGLEVDRLDLELLLIKARLLAAQGQTAEASAALKLAYRIAPEDPRAALRRAEDLLARGDLISGGAVLDRMIAPPPGRPLDRPRLARAHALLAAIDQQQGRHVAALGRIMAALALQPDSAQLRVECGRLLKAVGEREQGNQQIGLGLKLSGLDALRGAAARPAADRVSRSAPASAPAP